MEGQLHWSSFLIFTVKFTFLVMTGLKEVIKMKKLSDFKDEIKEYLEKAAPGTEDYNEAVDSLHKLSQDEAAEAKLKLEREKLEFEKSKLYAENVARYEEAKAKKLDSWLQLAGKGLLVGGSLGIAAVVEKGKEEGKILKTNEFFNQALNLIRKA